MFRLPEDAFHLEAVRVGEEVNALGHHWWDRNLQYRVILRLLFLEYLCFLPAVEKRSIQLSPQTVG